MLNAARPAQVGLNGWVRSQSYLLYDILSHLINQIFSHSQFRWCRLDMSPLPLAPSPLRIRSHRPFTPYISHLPPHKSLPPVFRLYNGQIRLYPPYPPLYSPPRTPNSLGHPPLPKLSASEPRREICASGKVSFVFGGYCKRRCGCDLYGSSCGRSGRDGVDEVV